MRLMYGNTMQTHHNHDIVSLTLRFYAYASYNALIKQQIQKEWRETEHISTKSRKETKLKKKEERKQREIERKNEK